jgi:hypothetical protein
MLFADSLPMPTSDHVVTLGTMGTLIAGIVAWVLKSALPSLVKQHRDDVFQVHKECRDERREDRERYVREAAQREERLDTVLETMNQLVQSLAQLVEVLGQQHAMANEKLSHDVHTN